MVRRLFLSFILPVVAAALVSAQAQFSDTVRAYIKVDAPVVALTNVRVIDGTGAPARPNQTVIIRNGTIDAHRRQRQRGSSGRRHDARPVGTKRHPRARDGARTPLLPDRPWRLRSAWRELQPPVSRRRRDDDEDRRQRQRLHGLEAETLDRLRAEGRPSHRRHRALPEWREHLFADAGPEGARKMSGGRWRTGPTRGRRRSRPTCRSAARNYARRSKRPINAA